MLAFEVRDMTCGHCVSAITQAIRAVDRDAKVEIDLSAHQVRIESTETDADELRTAIQQAGYTPVALATGAQQAATPAVRSGCCCR